MMNTRKTLLSLIAVNAVFMFVIVVVMSYLFYPLDTGLFEFIRLKKMYKELVEYKKETGILPHDLETLYRYEPNERRLFFGSTYLDYCPNDVNVNDIKRNIHYEIRNSEPVLVDLGDDAKEGGFGSDVDIGYPSRCSFSFRDFMKTSAFGQACWIGFLFSLVFTGSIGLEWRRSCGKPISVVGLVLGSVFFVIVETVLAVVIMLLDVFPHH